ncbi:hypothetical protein ACGFYU_36550 [Streptomyces sp. NPDC048337]|uniref:hypothetical protein n=1 Tax=Streptomyces sp. NPDC048337 TaxID=3365535 RepID=UPI0037235D81
MRAHYLAPLLLICVSLTGCGGGENKPKASDSPSPTAEEIAYYDCLKDRGLKIEHKDGGAPRVDKSQPFEQIKAAEDACADKMPPPPSPSQAAPEVIAAGQRKTDCMRAEGVTWYPDPDPVTGDFTDAGMTPEQRSSLKRDHTDALRKCKVAR